MKGKIAPTRIAFNEKVDLELRKTADIIYFGDVEALNHAVEVFGTGGIVFVRSENTLHALEVDSGNRATWFRNKHVKGHKAFKEAARNDGVKFDDGSSKNASLDEAEQATIEPVAITYDNVLSAESQERTLDYIFFDSQEAADKAEAAISKLCSVVGRVTDKDNLYIVMVNSTDRALWSTEEIVAGGTERLAAGSQGEVRSESVDAVLLGSGSADVVQFEAIYGVEQDNGKEELCSGVIVNKEDGRYLRPQISSEIRDVLEAARKEVLDVKYNELTDLFTEVGGHYAAEELSQEQKLGEIKAFLGVLEDGREDHEKIWQLRAVARGIEAVAAYSFTVSTGNAEESIKTKLEDAYAVAYAGEMDKNSVASGEVGGERRKSIYDNVVVSPLTKATGRERSPAPSALKSEGPIEYVVGDVKAGGKKLIFRSSQKRAFAYEELRKNGVGEESLAVKDNTIILQGEDVSALLERIAAIDTLKASMETVPKYSYIAIVSPVKALPEGELNAEVHDSQLSVPKETSSLSNEDDNSMSDESSVGSEKQATIPSTNVSKADVPTKMRDSGYAWGKVSEAMAKVTRKSAREVNAALEKFGVEGELFTTKEITGALRELRVKNPISDAIAVVGELQKQTVAQTKPAVRGLWG